MDELKRPLGAAPARRDRSAAQRGREKMAGLPLRFIPRPGAPSPPRPPWLRVRLPGGGAVPRLKKLLRAQRLHTVCEEASCPNLGECFSRGTATFMILGALCTRRCPFCDVAHGRPLPPDRQEPGHLAAAVRAMGLSYVVITSVDRDDLADGGAGHFAACVRAVRAARPGIRVEILVPDFKKRRQRALDALECEPPDVFNHNLETVPRLYRSVRPGADYRNSLELLRDFKQRHPELPTKSGLMLGLGEEIEEVHQVLRDLRAHGCEMLTLGQYLQPSPHHLAVRRYLAPEEFTVLGAAARYLGFSSVASAPLVRSSYHADAHHAEVRAAVACP